MKSDIAKELPTEKKNSGINDPSPIFVKVSKDSPIRYLFLCIPIPSRNAPIAAETPRYSAKKAIINKIEESDQTMEKYGRARALFYASINDRTKLQQISTEPSLDILLLTGKDQQAIELLKKQIGEGREFHYLKLKYNPYLYKLEANPLFIDFMNEKKSAYEDHLANYINLGPYD